ncbi:glucose-6-phosphate isomerase [bacterium]|nr:glucose-6-phosphate isomerase [bacterium]
MTATIKIHEKDLDKTEVYRKLILLTKKRVDLKKILTKKRIEKCIIKTPLLGFSFATSLINDEILKLLQKLADEQMVVEKYQQILNGSIMNVGEKRAVLHHKTRSKKRGFYGKEQKKIAAFTKKIHTGTIKGATDKKFETVVQIGIGGSDLGPRALCLALEKSCQHDALLKARFIANVDPDDAHQVLNSIDFEKTLFIVVSKSGTTQETLTNLNIIRKKFLEIGYKKENLKKHFIAVTGKGSPLDNPQKYLASFYIDDCIGGRYSSTSAVGGAILSLAFGAPVFEKLLKGAFVLDENANKRNIMENMSLMAALIGVWERSFLGLPSKAIIPYSEALSRFPAHLQQLDCESNGKSVNINFKKINYQTGPMIFGEPGTNGQHSFFQKLHQGSDVIPIQFIGFKHAQINKDKIYMRSTSQKKLISNLVAQIAAFALGKYDENENKNFSGNRPSSLIFADKLTPYTLGALLAFYENIVMFQSFIWNINAFDQEGVQLGKILTKKILATEHCDDEILNSLMAIFQ